MNQAGAQLRTRRSRPPSTTGSTSSSSCCDGPTTSFRRAPSERSPLGAETLFEAETNDWPLRPITTVMAIEVSGPALDAIELIEQLGDAVVAADLCGKITLYNAAAEEIYGYAPTRSLVRSRHAHSRTDRRPARRRAQPGAQRRDPAVTRSHADQFGSVCGVELTLIPLRDCSRAIVGSVGVTRDVSGASAARAPARGHVAPGQRDRDGRCGGHRPRRSDHDLQPRRRGAAGLHGRGDGRAPQRDGHPRPRRDQAPRGGQWRRAAPYAFASGERDEDIWTFVRKDGTRVKVLLTIRANFNRFGEVEGFISFGRDVSEMQKAEIARMHAEERFRTAFVHAPIGLAIASLEGSQAGCWTQTNPALARMLGYDRASSTAFRSTA